MITTRSKSKPCFCQTARLVSNIACIILLPSGCYVYMPFPAGTTVMKNDYIKFIVAELQNETRKTDYKLMYLMNSKFTVQ